MEGQTVSSELERKPLCQDCIQVVAAPDNPLVKFEKVSPLVTQKEITEGSLKVLRAEGLDGHRLFIEVPVSADKEGFPLRRSLK